MYRVGLHIPAGEYKAIAEKYITIEDGQYLKLINATIKVGN